LPWKELFIMNLLFTLETFCSHLNVDNRRPWIPIICQDLIASVWFSIQCNLLIWYNCWDVDIMMEHKSTIGQPFTLNHIPFHWFFLWDVEIVSTFHYQFISTLLWCSDHHFAMLSTRP
jgi:hypothetical protein